MTRILALNSGSSSLKFGVFEANSKEWRTVTRGEARGIGRDRCLLVISKPGEVSPSATHAQYASHGGALEHIASMLEPHRIEAVGHRLVHGGQELCAHMEISAAVVETLDNAVHFAPLHTPSVLDVISRAEYLFPVAHHYACFDTAFHAPLPDVVLDYPLPEAHNDCEARRYRFHGLSCESVLRQMGSVALSRIVIAHLGSSSSVTAVLNAECIDNMMVITPNCDIPIAARTGNLDPGALLYLLRSKLFDLDGVESLIKQQCGWIGSPAGEADMELLLARERQGNACAHRVIEAFVTSIRKAIGAHASLLGGIDQIIFTGGIGEHSEPLRIRICSGLSWLSSAMDNPLTMEAQEELQIAIHCRNLREVRRMLPINSMVRP